MIQRVKLDNGWVVEVDKSAHPTGYTVEKIFARFDHGVYLPLDLTGFSQEQWDIFHERIKEAGIYESHK